MSTRDKLIIIIGASLIVVVGIIAAFFLPRSSGDVSTIFGKIERADISSVARLRSKILTIDFKTSEEAPETASVFKISEKEISRNKARATAVKFGFKGTPRGALTLTWIQGSRILNIDLDNRSLDFKNLNIKALKGNFSAKKLAATAMKVLKQKGLPTKGLIADTENTRLLEVKGTAVKATTKSSGPTFIEIGFNRKLNEHNLFYPNPTEPPVLVTLNNKGHVFRVSYKFTNINDITVGTYPLLDIKQVPIAKLVSIGAWVSPQSGEGIFEPALIKTIIIEDFSLAYLDDQSGDFVQPIYILRGFATVGKESISIVIYYPALQEEWLK